MRRKSAFALLCAVAILSAFATVMRAATMRAASPTSTVVTRVVGLTLTDGSTTVGEADFSLSKYTNDPTVGSGVLFNGSPCTITITNDNYKSAGWSGDQTISLRGETDTTPCTFGKTLTATDGEGAGAFNIVWAMDGTYVSSSPSFTITIIPNAGKTWNDIFLNPNASATFTIQYWNLDCATPRDPVELAGS